MVAFTIDFSDTAGNAGNQATSTTDGTSVVATTVPSSPTNVSEIPGNLLATVSWTAPASDGGSTVTEYTVISSLGEITATTTATHGHAISNGYICATDGYTYTATHRHAISDALVYSDTCIECQLFGISSRSPFRDP